MNKTNSIKYLLNKRNKKQKELRVYRPDGKCLFNKQYVSKVIHRHFRMPETIILEWSNILQIPSKYFVEEGTGKCKLLTSIDIHEIDSYIDAQFFLENSEKDSILRRSAESEFALRQHYLSTKITKLQRSIRKDIYSVQHDVVDAITALDIQESNLEFYKKVTELHGANLINNAEWNSFFRAFAYVTDNIAEEDIRNENPLVYGIYVLIKKSRELNTIENMKNMQMYEELFGSLLSNFDSYYE